MRWTCIEPGDPDDITRRVYRSVDDGGRWTLAKEWYAHGPSLFSWMLYGPDNERRFCKEFWTKKSASEWVDAWVEVADPRIT